MSTVEPPPLRPSGPPKRASSFLGLLLSLILVFFLASGVIGLISEAQTLFFGSRDLAGLSGLVMLFLLVTGLLTYVLLALFPGIPKRYFLPVSLWVPVAGVASLPMLIYFFDRVALIGFALALVHVFAALFIIRRLQGGAGFRWPLVPEEALAARSFSWGNFCGVLLAGIFLVIPAIAFCGAFSARLAVAHFTDGFVALGPSGVSMQVRKYVRDDGKKITLVPMSHIGEEKFYRDLARSFPADSVILMEGVTDSSKVMGKHLDYSRAAAAIGGVSQVDAFRPPGEIVAADLDMTAFAPETLELLKTAQLFHTKGITPETLPLFSKPMPPGIEKLIIADILTKRNQHLLSVLQERLPGSSQIVIPWGAAHLPGIAREIQKLGFHVVETQEFLAIAFGK
jgi:hypothetical protein